MRILAAVVVIATAILHGQSLATQAKNLAAGEEPDPFVGAAIELRCADSNANSLFECESELRQSFADGTSKPEAVVRRHCSYFENEWATGAPHRSPVCSEIAELQLES